MKSTSASPRPARFQPLFRAWRIAPPGGKAAPARARLCRSPTDVTVGGSFEARLANASPEGLRALPALEPAPAHAEREPFCGRNGNC